MALERLNNPGPFDAIDFLTPDCSSIGGPAYRAPTPVGCDEVDALSRCACCGAKISFRVVVESRHDGQTYFLGRKCAQAAEEVETRGLKKMERVATARGELARWIATEGAEAATLPHPYGRPGSLTDYAKWIAENRTDERPLRRALSTCKGQLEAKREEERKAREKGEEAAAEQAERDRVASYSDEKIAEEMAKCKAWITAPAADHLTLGSETREKFWNQAIEEFKRLVEEQKRREEER